MNPQMLGPVVGVVGCVIGVLGGLAGTYYAVRSTHGPQRTFALRMAALLVGITGFLMAVLFVPQPYNFLLWVPYGVALPLALRAMGRRAEELRPE